jgi:hypothetical protein
MLKADVSRLARKKWVTNKRFEWLPQPIELY